MTCAAFAFMHSCAQAAAVACIGTIRASSIAASQRNGRFMLPDYARLMRIKRLPGAAGMIESQEDAETDCHTRRVLRPRARDRARGGGALRRVRGMVRETQLVARRALPPSRRARARALQGACPSLRAPGASGNRHRRLPLARARL